MTGIALLIVLTSGFLHAGWNLLLKKGDRKIVFIWWFQLVALIIYFPMLLYYWGRAPIPPTGWQCILATGLIHGGYFWFMSSAYQRGDLSLVYPLARGSGPLFIPILAIVLLKEQISLLGGLGIFTIVIGIYCIHLRSFDRGGILEPFRDCCGEATRFAFFTGLTVASYSIVDKVGAKLVYPPVYIYLMFLIAWLTLTPLILTREREWVLPEVRKHAAAIFIVGFFSVFTYLMILFAFTISKVSYVAAVREVSIILSAYFGVFYLGEQHGKQKLFGSLLITLGVIAIGLSR